MGAHPGGMFFLKDDVSRRRGGENRCRRLSLIVQYRPLCVRNENAAYRLAIKEP
jgi:hypothetical protein